MNIKNLVYLGGIGGAGLFVMFMVWRVFSYVLSAPVGFGAVAALVLVGLAAFLAIMNILSFSAHAIGISDAKQAFGLPEGSVRAILTISFIILVGVLASYLVTNSDGHTAFAREPIVLACRISLADAQAREKAIGGADGLVSITPSVAAAPGRGTGRLILATPCQLPAEPATTAETPVGATMYDVSFFPKVDHRLGDDVSKQILTMLSTILAAMIGFYFGAKPGESDPDATRRAQAAAGMAAQVSGAPDTDAMAARADDLLAKASAAPEDLAQRAELVQLKARIKTAAETMVASNATRVSLSASAAQMTAAATAMDGAMADMKAVDKRLGEIAGLQATSGKP